MQKSKLLIEALRNIILTHSKELYKEENIQRFKALISDNISKSIPERDMLRIAISKNIGVKLLSVNTETEVEKRQVIDEAQKELMRIMKAESATIAVSLLAAGLGWDTTAYTANVPNIAPAAPRSRHRTVFHFPAVLVIASVACIVCLVVALLFSHQKSVRYFESITIQENGFPLFGREITAKQAKITQEYCKATYHKNIIQKVVSIFEDMIAEDIFRKDGRLVSSTLYDRRHKISIKDGYARMRVFYDEENVVDFRYYDLHDALTITHFGFAIQRFFFSANGALQKSVYYDTNGFPTNTNWGMATIHYEYDPTETLAIEESYYDKEGNRTTFAATGIAGKWLVWNSQGLLTKEAYYDTNRQRTTRLDNGVYAIWWEYDSNGNIIEESYHTALMSDTLMLCTDRGVAIIRYSYDNNGLLQEERYYDTNERPIARTDTGATVTHYTY